jgi:hypothetical protein
LIKEKGHPANRVASLGRKARKASQKPGMSLTGPLRSLVYCSGGFLYDAPDSYEGKVTILEGAEGALQAKDKAGSIGSAPSHIFAVSGQPARWV